MISEVFGAFLEGSPVSVMFRATLERTLNAAKMDAIFSQAAVRQKTGELLFSTCVDLMALVVAKVRKSVHAAYRARADQVEVSVRSIYNKLAGIEPQVSEQMVATTGAEMVALLPQMGVRPEAPLPGYKVRLVDGNYLAGTEHRLAELRILGSGRPPGNDVVHFRSAMAVGAGRDCLPGRSHERTKLGRPRAAQSGSRTMLGRRSQLLFLCMVLRHRRSAGILRGPTTSPGRRRITGEA